MPYFPATLKAAKLIQFGPGGGHNAASAFKSWAKQCAQKGICARGFGTLAVNRKTFNLRMIIEASESQGLPVAGLIAA